MKNDSQNVALQFEKDYMSAEITLFWAEIPEVERNCLIFAVTELIPENQLPSPTLGGGKAPYLKKSISSSPKAHIFCRRFFCTVECAIACFKSQDWSSLEDGPQNIEPPCSPRREPPKGLAVTLPQGRTPLGRDATSLSMVLPNRPTCFRTCSYLDDKSPLNSYFSPSQRKQIQKFVQKYCGANLGYYCEFLGASILCMQNPILWGIQSFGRDSSGKLNLLLLPRDGKSVDGMYYVVRSHHPFGQIESALTKISSAHLILDFPNQQLEPELNIWDSNGQLLETKPLSFFGHISGVTTTHRRLPDGRSIPVWPTQYYEPRKQSVLEQYETIRMYERLEIKKEFFYFKAGEQTKARSILGGLLACGGREIVICDMYLDEEGFDTYIRGWVRCKDLTLIASKRRLNKNKDGTKHYLKSKIEQRVSKLIQEKVIQTASLLGISGKHQDGSVHDRFLIIDGIAYCIGSSLNGFGDRDTLV